MYPLYQRAGYRQIITIQSPQEVDRADLKAWCREENIDIADPACFQGVWSEELVVRIPK